MLRQIFDRLDLERDLLLVTEPQLGPAVGAHAGHPLSTASGRIWLTQPGVQRSLDRTIHARRRIAEATHGIGVVKILDQATEQLLGKTAEDLTLGSVQDVEHTSQMLLTRIEDCCAASVTSIRQVQRNGAAVAGTGLPYDQPVGDEPIH
jgi:hypothetical protein